MRDERHEWVREYRVSWLRKYRTSLQERLLDDVMFNLQEPIHRHSTNKKMHTPTRDVGDNPPNERPYCSSITSFIAAASRALRIARLRTRHFARRSQSPHCPSRPSSDNSLTWLPRGRWNCHKSPAQSRGAAAEQRSRPAGWPTAALSQAAVLRLPWSVQRIRTTTLDAGPSAIMQATLRHAFRMLLQHTSNAQQATGSALRAANDSRRSTMTQQMPSVCTCRAQPNVSSTRRNRHDTVTGVCVIETRSTSGNR